MLTKHPKLLLGCIVPVTNIEKGKEGVVLYKRVMIKIFTVFECVPLNVTETAVFCITSNPVFTKIRLSDAIFPHPNLFQSIITK